MLIICLLNKGFKLKYVKSFEIAENILIDDVSYYLDWQSKENNGFIGFFDWLRKDEFSIVGIRICFFEHHGYNEVLHNLPYVKSSFGGKCLEILFNEEVYNPDISGDQDFSDNYVYRSTNEDYLITFNLDHLTEMELNNLLKYCD